MAKKYQSVFEQIEAENKKQAQAKSASAFSKTASPRSAFEQSPYASVYQDLGLIGNTNTERKYVLPSDIPDNSYYPGKNNTGNDSLDAFLARLKNEKEKSALQTAKNNVQENARSLWKLGRQAQDENGNTVYGNKLRLVDDPSQLYSVKSKTPVTDAINYANARGAQALDAFNTNLNVLGEQAYATLKAAADTAKQRQSNIVFPQIRESNLPVLTTGMKTPEEINQTKGARSGFAGQLKNNVRAANTAVLEKALQEDRNAKTLETVEKEYSAVSNNPIVHALGDLTATISGQAPAIAVSAATAPLGGALLRGATSSVDAYIDARKEGASVAQAKKYASREAVNQGIGDILLTGIAGTGKGVLSKTIGMTKVGRSLARAYGTAITAPAAKTAIKYLGNMLGEGVEEALQNAVTVANKRLSYKPDVKVNPREMLYEGVLGAATAGILGAASVPDTYQVYKSDVDTVNEISKAAAAVKTEEEARYVQLQADILTDWCNLTINDPTTDFDTRARNEYIKAGVAAAVDTMNANLETIISQNDAFDAAVDFVGEGDAGNIVDEVADLVTVVADETDPDQDVIRATIDRVNEEIRNTTDMAEAISTMSDDDFDEWMRSNRMNGTLGDVVRAATENRSNLLPGATTPFNTQTVEAARQQVLRELQIRRALLDRINSTLRNQKADVKNAVAGLMESAKTDLQDGAGRAIIPVETNNPVMLADGKSITQPDNAGETSVDGTKYDLSHQEYTHSKTGEKMHLYKLGRNLSGDDYKALSSAVKDVGGYWSRFAKGFIVPEDGLSKLPGALQKIGVGIDESQYKPAATTSQTIAEEKPARPQFEVYQGGELVPANDQASVQGMQAETPAVQSESETTGGSAFETNAATAPDMAIRPAGSTPSFEKTPINTSTPKEKEKPEAGAWKDAVRELGGKWAGIDKGDITYALDDLYKIAHATGGKNEDGSLDLGRLDVRTIGSAATDYAKDLIDSASTKEDNPDYNETLEARKYLRTTPIYIDREKMIADFGDATSYNRWRKSLFGKLNITTDRSRGIGADVIFDEFADNFPGYVDLTVNNDIDRLKELANAATELRRQGGSKKTDVNPYEINRDEAVQNLAVDLQMELLNRLTGQEPERSWKQKKQAAKEPQAEEKNEEKTAIENGIEKAGVSKLRSYQNSGVAYDSRPADVSLPRSDSRPADVSLPRSTELVNPEDTSLTESSQEGTRAQAQGDALKESREVIHSSDDTEKSVIEPESLESTETTIEKTSPYETIGTWVLDRLDRGLDISKKDLQIVANDAYGGTMAEGKYDVKDMTDALELGVNRFIIHQMQDRPDLYNSERASNATEAHKNIDHSILERIPAQTNRTEEQIKLQQFSTPPNIAYLANWIANIDSSDTVLEPSAGIGGLASFAKGMGAKVIVNELSPRRLSLLKTLPFDGFYHENAEQIDNILPSKVKPTVVVMNPPFSSNGRTKNKTANAIPHIEQALERLEDGGRLVAILGGGRDTGGGMSDSAPSFKKWWDKLRGDYDIRANIGIDGKNYSKYGTSFNVQLVVIDKTGPQNGVTLVKNYTDLGEIPGDLEEIRNDRRRKTGTGGQAEPDGTVSDSGNPSESGETTATQSRIDVGKRPADSGTSNVRGRGQSVSAVSSGGDNQTSGEPEMVQPTSGDEVHVSDGGFRTGRGGERGSESVSAGSGEQPGEGRVDAGQSGRDVDGQPGELVQPQPGVSGAAGAVITDDRGKAKKPRTKKAAESDDGVYASYKPADLTIKGAKKHPAKLVESSAMSAVQSPPLTYKPKLDQKLIESGAWSDAQLENISYAGQAHREMLPDGHRKGYFVGDGTGVGKGRQIAGIIMDNFNQGRKKAIWISENIGLMEDAKRDWRDVGGDEAQVFPFSDVKKKKGLPENGIMFLSYDTLRSKSAKTGKTNLELIEDWFGKNYDGAIIFDEAHNMGNLTPIKSARGRKKPSAKAIAGDKLQQEVSNARVAYFSATGATNIENLSYASRLGLWGPGTAFENATDFISKIGSAGISAMELVARDMKAMGVYLARSISYDGVVYDNLTHNLSRQQKAMYDRMSEGWQVVLQNFDKAMQATNSENATEVKQRRGQAYSNMQQFYNQVLTSMSMPSVIANIEKELDAGHSCVIQLVNTNEAAQDREIQRVKENDADLDELDITPRQLLVGYVENAFPIYQYEEYLDENGNKQSQIVTDSQGKPVVNKKALAMKNALIADLNDISIPEGPLDLLLNHFGTENVAEVTGRSQRVVNKTDERGNVKKVVERRDSKKANIAEAQAFQDGKKRILVFSNAGSTGRSFHADRRAKNQQQRIHYVLQPGWRADKAVQGFGRTHRSNQVNEPVFRLISTDVKGHKRFVTSIARRLDQLGALTKGQRQTGSGVFGEKDNLESPLSVQALKTFYKRLGNGGYPDLDKDDVLKRMGLWDKFHDEYDNFNADTPVAGEITTFLNRLLALPVDEQNRVFDAFEQERDKAYNKAIEEGTLDRGLENVRADKVVIEDESVVYTDPKSGAETTYVRAKLYDKPKVITTVAEAQEAYPGFVDVYRMKDGSVRAAYRRPDVTDPETGVVYKQYLLVGPNQGKASRYGERTLKSTCEPISKKEWQTAWDEELARVPEYNESEVHMITGALLPIWNKLPQDGNIRARRIVASDGSAQYLGRLISPQVIDSVLRGLNVRSAEKKYSGKELREAIMRDGKLVTINAGSGGGVISVGRRRVSGENRMEISAPNTWWLRSEYPNLIQEYIQYRNRYFIPDSAEGENILQDMADKNGVRSVADDENGGEYYSAGLSRGKWGRGNRDKGAQVMSVSDLVNEAKRIFGIPINVGKMGNRPRNVQGVFKEQPETIRTRQYGDLPTIAHEIGHWFDKKYLLRESPYIGTLTAEYGAELTAAGYNPSMFTRESVAEFFSDYMNDREATEKKFPQFTNWMYQKVNPTDQRKLLDYSSMTNAYHAADLDRRANAQIHYRTDDGSVQAKAQVVAEEMKRNPREYLGELSRAFVRGWFDDLVDLRGFGKTYDLAMYEKQARSIAYGRLVYGMTDKDGNPVGKSLAQILSDGKIDARNRNDFDAYLIARVALDRMEAAAAGEDVGTLVYADEELNSMDSLLDRIDKYERENPSFAAAADGVYEYQNHLLDLAVSSGLMSEDLKNRLNELYPHYVPLYRFMDDESQKSRGVKRGYEGQKTPIARFKGSGRDIYSPIENIILNTEKFTVAAMRNDVMMEFADFIDNNEGMGWAAEKIPPAMVLQKISTDELGDKLRQFTGESDMLTTMSEKERAKFYESLMSFIGDTLGQWKPSGKKGVNVVSVMRNGSHEYYEIHDDGLYKALTNMNAPQFDMLTKFFGTLTRFEKGLFTSTNPQFIFTNPQRDLVTGFVSSTTTDNPFVYVKDFILAFKDAVSGDETYKKYMQSGGGYMGSLTSDYNVLKRVSNDVVQEDKSQIKRFMDGIASSVPRLVDAGETASRLAEYKRAINQGDSNMEAIRKAQEVTVNFARGGTIVKRINQYIPFFQAGFSALAHDYDLFVNGGDGGGGRNGNNGYGLDLSPEGKRRRAKAWAKWLLTTGLLALITWLFNYRIAPKITGESEEEVKQNVDNLSNYNKNAYYPLYMGNGKFLKIKKTQDMAIPATIVERMFEYAVLDQKDALNSLADYVFDNVLSISLNPLDVLSDVTLIGPVVNVLRNQDFKGTPILSKRYEYLPKTEQYAENTSVIAIQLGEILNASPIQLQYLGESYFGWVARLANNLTPLNGERSLGISNKLVADSAYSTDIINNFYNQKEKYDKGASGYKAHPTSTRYSSEDVYGAYKYGKIAALYSDLNNLTRAEGDNELSRAMRIQTNAFIQTVNEDGLNELDRSVLDLADRAGIGYEDYDAIAPYIPIPDKLTVKSKNASYELPLDYDDMILYYNQSQTAFEAIYGQIMQAGYSDDVTADLMKEAKKVISKDLRDSWKQRLVYNKLGE